MKKIFICFSIFFFVSIPSFSQERVEWPSFKIKVMDSLTQKPLDSVKLTFRKVHEETTKVIYVNKTFDYKVENDWALLVIEKEGYLPAKPTLFLTNPYTDSCKVYMRKKSPEKKGVKLIEPK